METVDIILGVIILIAFYLGFKKGLFVTLASLIALISGVYGAIYFSGYAAEFLSDRFDWSEQTTQLAAFAVTFVVIVFVISLAGKFLTKLADFAALGIINKLLGGVFNAIKYVFIVSVIFMFVNASENYSIVPQEQRDNSVLYYPVASVAPILIPHILKEVEDLNDPEEETNPETETPSETI
ncbi:CvpA family protein [Cochleicola gelatinilyticus]|uniref:Colicin V production protein n=1 Tax=Cochleicola gelatinilyticus TaxID=1763537 RepID=A0A167JG23_9FLAO|nr:CvpA family protein [Cochleicola gelatinilyticus]OAB80639.1 colicin V production protein [Cochleicola gelatinilyticus]